MAIVAGLLWTALTLYLLWLSAGASVAVSEASFRRLMTGPGYLIAQQLKPLSAKQREVRLDVLRQHFQYPVNLVERDSIDANGPKYRVNPEITCGQIAALATCLHAARSDTVERTVKLAESFRDLLGGGIMTI